MDVQTTIIFLAQSSERMPGFQFENENYQLLYAVLFLLSTFLLAPLMQMMVNSRSFSELQLKERLSAVNSSNEELKKRAQEAISSSTQISQDYQKLIGDVRVLRASVKGALNQFIAVLKIMKNEDNIEQLKAQINSLEVLIKSLKDNLKI